MVSLSANPASFIFGLITGIVGLVLTIIISSRIRNRKPVVGFIVVAILGFIFIIGFFLLIGGLHYLLNGH
jgi:hypothetical protein